ncbi:MAG: hypothetical protein LQ341_006337 [Variospora aurantia]|nr:MAG: hypothetical protein LQ341_006337 [Variospora aurantia]
MVLGKRKRRTQIEVSAEEPLKSQYTDHDSHIQHLLRQHFETKFEPLDTSTTGSPQESVDKDNPESDSYNTDWTGFSEEEEQADTILVDYQNLEKARVDVPREELKLFMSARPPTQPINNSSTIKHISSDSAGPEDGATDAANLKKDLALQRLLEESHLLDATSSLTPTGRNRHKALDIRQQALGSRSSIYSQKKMPLAQRRGIMAKIAEKDQNRRNEAKENGVILERVTKSKDRDSKRQREIGAPTVGRFSGGMLTLSRKDVTNIVGRPKKSKRR